jgi:hypothetical protein
MTIEGLEAYILVPRDGSELGLLISTLRPAPALGDLDLVSQRHESCQAHQLQSSKSPENLWRLV